jgi:hypothetical protein
VERGSGLGAGKIGGGADDGGAGGGGAELGGAGGGGAGGGGVNANEPLDFRAVGGTGGALRGIEIEEAEGLEAGLGGGAFLRAATDSMTLAGDVSADFGVGRNPLGFGTDGAGVDGSAGGFGAELAGGLGNGGLDISESETEAWFESSDSTVRFLPPGVFLNLGMPPANRPPSCGAVASPLDSFGIPPPV